MSIYLSANKMFKWFSNYNTLSDEQLMELVASGKTLALDELYERYHRKLYFFLSRMMGGKQAKAEDLLQEVFLKVIDKAHQFNSTHKFKTWIFTIASNMCKNEYRSQKIRSVVETQTDIDRYTGNEKDQEQLVEETIFASALQDELDQMEPERKSTFILRFQENYSIVEIAKILECSPGTIKSRLHYITRELAAKLKDYNSNEIEVFYEK